MAAFGKSAAGCTVRNAYRPELIDFSFGVTAARAARERMELSIPLPDGWSFDRKHSQLLLEHSPASFAEFRALFGYVASIGDAESTDTDSPFLFQVVAKLFFRYGTSPAELVGSFVFARVNAWSSKAVLDRSFEAVCLGMPVQGLLTPTDSKYASAQLNCWRPTTFQEWKIASPRSFFDLWPFWITMRFPTCRF